MFRTEQLISPDYLATQVYLHAQPRGYGGRGDKWADVVVELAHAYGATSILDYGCGQGSLGRALAERRLPGVRLAEYDPAIPGKDGRPEFADLVVCTDVLEHIEPERIGAVLAHLRGLARKAIWCVISTKPSNKTLPDGRNAHILIRPESWWREALAAAGFTLHDLPDIEVRPGKEFGVVLTP